MVRLIALFLALMTAGPVLATCRLALVLALDVSSSVDQGEYDLQRVGLAAALDAPEVRHAILRGAPGDVALSVYEWSGHFQQKMNLDWTVLRSDADITRAVGVLAAMTRSTSDYPTALGAGLGYGAQVMARAPKCDHRVIDISGDGINNDGFGPDLAYRNFPLGGITVNGLVILGHDPDVLNYYQRHVVRGPRAFAEVAQGFDDFQAAMTRKLYREINDIVLGALAPAPNILPQ